MLIVWVYLIFWIIGVFRFRALLIILHSMKLLCGHVCLFHQVDRFWGTSLHPSVCGLPSIQVDAWQVGHQESIRLHSEGQDCGSFQLCTFPLAAAYEIRVPFFKSHICMLSSGDSILSLLSPSLSNPLHSLKREGVLIRGWSEFMHHKN